MLARVALDEDPAPRQLLERGDRLLVAAAAHVAERGRGRTGGRAPRPRRRPARPPRRRRRARASSRPRTPGGSGQSRRRPLARRGTRRRRTAGPASRRTAAPTSSARRPAAAASSATSSRSSRSSSIVAPSPSRVASASMRRAGWSGGVSSGPPGHEHEQQRPSAEPAREEGEHLERRRVGPVRVVDDEHARALAARSPRAGHARRRRGSAPARPGRRASASAACRARAAAAPPRRPRRRIDGTASPSRERAAQQLDHAAEGELGLVLDAARRSPRTAASARDQATSSSASRVLPIPVSPSSTTSRPSGPTAP